MVYDKIRMECCYYDSLIIPEMLEKNLPQIKNFLTVVSPEFMVKFKYNKN